VTVAPIVVALVVGLIIILAIAAVGFALAWRHAELENCKLRSRYLYRFAGLPKREAL
jgi:hypothetical protein